MLYNYGVIACGLRIQDSTASSLDIRDGVFCTPLIIDAKLQEFRSVYSKQIHLANKTKRLTAQREHEAELRSPPTFLTAGTN